MATRRGFVLVSTRCCSRRRGDGVLLSSGDSAVERSCPFSRGFSTSAERTVAEGMASASVRRQMVPLIKLVHPDLFGQYPPSVASTNQKSLKDLNTLIDAAEALEEKQGGSNGGESNPAVNLVYRLTFFHHDKTSSSKPSGSPRSDEGSSTPPLVRDDGSKTEDVKSQPRLSRLEAELRFPPILSADPAASLREQLREQLGYLLDRVHEITTGKARATRKSGFGEGLGVKDDDLEGARDSEKPKRRSGPKRDGLRVERESKSRPFWGENDDPGRTDYDVEDMILRHAGDHHFLQDRSINLGLPFFERFPSSSQKHSPPRRRDKSSPTPRRVPAGATGEHRNWKALNVDALLRSGRVQFAGVPIVREALALTKLHKILSDHFDDLEMHDRALWSTVTIVIRAKATTYEVTAHAGGPIFVVPENFSEKNLVLFLAENLLRES